jgi:hypothetical protein
MVWHTPAKSNVLGSTEDLQKVFAGGCLLWDEMLCGSLFWKSMFAMRFGRCRLQKLGLPAAL